VDFSGFFRALGFVGVVRVELEINLLAPWGVQEMDFGRELNEGGIEQAKQQPGSGMSGLGITDVEMEAEGKL
jgi:hypothetical protein